MEVKGSFLAAFFVLTWSSFIWADQSQLLFDEPEGASSSGIRVAVIGAGAAGSSAAYHLQKFSQAGPDPIPLDITIFDTSTRVGGRTTTVNALDDPKYPTELGGSIFVQINHILYNFTREFGFNATSKIFRSSPGSKYDLGIWDGSEFVLIQANDDGRSRWQGWWDLVKLLWKYGLSPITTQRLTKNAVGKFLRFYDEPLFPFSTLQAAVEETDLLQYVGATGEQVLQTAGVSELFSREVIQASTRVNYGQNLGGIHGLEALVCMAIEGAIAVEGGNWQLFDEAVKRSHATVKLNNTVTEVVKSDKGGYHIHTSTDQVGEERSYDTVILAAPYQFANITFTPPLTHPPETIPYVSLHVTLLTSPHRLSPSFFDLDSEDEVPSSVLTTLPKDLDLGSRRGIDAVGPPGFWSISTLRVLDPDSDGAIDHDDTASPSPSETESSQRPQYQGHQPQYLYKIFSPAPLTAAFISRLLDFPLAAEDASTDADTDTSLSAISKSDVTWFYQKIWKSYPYETPRTVFERIRLDGDPTSDLAEDSTGDLSGSLKQVQGNGIWYTSGIESFISTMETSALSGMNVARLIVDELRSRNNGTS